MSTQVTILGNTGRPVELNYTPQGVPVAKFSLASNIVRNTSQGRVEKTDWFNVSAFGRQAETLAKYLNKGAAILVRGRLSLSAWQTREGEPRVNADVILQDFEFAGGPFERQPETVVEAAAPNAETASEAIAEAAAAASPEPPPANENPTTEADIDPLDEVFAAQF